MHIRDIFKNEFLHNLGHDHIAVDHAGIPIARAPDRQALERAAPGAAAYFSADDLKDILPIPPAAPSQVPVPNAPFSPPVAPTIEPVKVMPVTPDMPDTPKPDWENETPTNLQPNGPLAELLKSGLSRLPEGDYHGAPPTNAPVKGTDYSTEYQMPDPTFAPVPAHDPIDVGGQPATATFGQLKADPAVPVSPAATFGQPDNRASAETVDANPQPPTTPHPYVQGTTSWGAPTPVTEGSDQAKTSTGYPLDVGQAAGSPAVASENGEAKNAGGYPVKPKLN
jgi:hypothetical protein